MEFLMDMAIFLRESADLVLFIYSNVKWFSII